MSAWAGRRGWSVIIEPGHETKGHLPSAGVAVFARVEVGLRRPHVDGQIVSGVLVAHRALHVVVDVPGWPEMNIFNLYLHCSEGLTVRNSRILSCIGQSLSGLTSPSIIGGDWNLEKAVLESSGFARTAQVQIVAPASVTCRTATSTSTIDFFCLSVGAHRLLKQIKVDATWEVKPHRPVQLVLAADGRRLQILTYAAVPKLPTAGVFGPVQQDFDWSMERRYAATAIEMAKEASADSAWGFLTLAWGCFITKAAERIGIRTGEDVKFPGSYARCIKAKWIDITYNGSDAEGLAAQADGWKWLSDALQGISILKQASINGDEERAAMLDDEMMLFQTSPYPGVHLCSRLDASVVQARRLIAGRFFPDQISEFLEEIDEDIELAKQAAGKDSHTRWKNWCDQAAAGGARALHKITQYNQVNETTVVQSVDGLPSAHPHAVVEATAEEYRVLWDASPEAPKAWIPDRSSFPRASAADIRAVAQTFSKATAGSLDGLHPRHLLLLSDESLDILGMLFEAFESLGVLPKQMLWICMPMLPKPMGGHRLIVLYGSIYRVWQRLRRPELAPLQQFLCRVYWGASSGRSAIDSAWQVAARVEACVHDKRKSLQIIADYSKYYETIDLISVREKFSRYGAPTCLTKLLFNTWSAPRTIRLMRHHCLQPVHARRGFPAGDAYADVGIKVHALEEYDRFVALHSELHFSSYIDDSSLGIEANTTDELIEKAVRVGRSFQATASRLGAKFNNKLSIVCSETGVGDKVAAKLGFDASSNKRAATYLGTDQAGGRSRRAASTRKKQQSRRRRFQHRVKKIARYRKAIPTKKNERTGKIFRTGARPALTFGVEITGLSDSEWSKLRRQYFQFVKPCHGGISASSKAVLFDDPSSRQALAPALQWSRMIWQAVLAPDAALVSLDQLRQWWTQALHDRTLEDLEWSSSRGPLERAALCVRRIGWKIKQWDVWLDHRGVEVPLKQFTPGVLEKRMTAALQRQLELDLAAKRGLPAGTRSSYDILRPFVRDRNSKFTSYQKFLVRSFALGGIWTRERARCRGYETDGRCDCGAPDTVHHRLFTCMRNDVVAARSASEVPPEFIQRGIDEQNSEFFEHGSFDYLDSEIPKMAPGHEAYVVNMAGEVQDLNPEEMVESACPAAQVIELAPDGSCSKPALRDLQRAGWAITLLNPSGPDPLLAVYGAVPPALPQTSVVAEYMGLAFCGQVADRPATMYFDFLGAVFEARKSPERQRASRSIYACVQVFGQSLPGREYLTAAEHVKAHRTSEQYQLLNVDQRRITDANIAADRFAKVAVALHPAPRHEFCKQIELHEEATRNLVRLISATLPCYEKEERWRRAPIFRRSRNVRTEGHHEWCRTELGVQCKCCLSVLHDNAVDWPLTGCRGTPVFLRQFFARPNGHCLVAVHQSGERCESVSDNVDRPVFVCTKCGAWAQQRRRHKLRSPCIRPTPKGLEILRNLRKGVGPHRKLQRSIDCAIPADRVAPTRRVPRRETTSVSARPDPASSYQYESRLAALQERVRQRELARALEGSAGGASGNGLV